MNYFTISSWESQYCSTFELMRRMRKNHYGQVAHDINQLGFDF